MSLTVALPNPAIFVYLPYSRDRLLFKRQINQKYVLRVAYEALVLTAMDDAKTPVTYFKFQDIICWGSSSYNFQFKVRDRPSVLLVLTHIIFLAVVAVFVQTL